jgi:hypothetical protein
MSDKPDCKMLDMDGNVFMVIGRVVKALKRDGQVDRAKEFAERARACENYDSVLRLCFEFVVIE